MFNGKLLLLSFKIIDSNMVWWKEHRNLSKTNLAFNSDYDLLAVKFSVSYLVALSLNVFIFAMGLIT